MVAAIDQYSRYVVNWSMSNTMDAEWCKETLEQTIELHGKSGIINTDQGSQFTSEIFADYVLGEEIKLSMNDERMIPPYVAECTEDIQMSEPRSGRVAQATDNAFIEVLRRNVKYEKIYLNPPKNGLHLYQLCAEYFDYHNKERRHQGINNDISLELFGQHLKNKAV